MANTIVKTPIVYYGGKTSMLNHILPLVPVHEVYTETFFGGGSLFWAKDPVKNETINDRLDIVVNFYKCLRLHFAPLKRLIDATLISRNIHNEALSFIKKYNKIHKQTATLSTSAKVKLAWAFWVCTNFAFSNKIGGGYKYSNHQSVSVPDTLAKRKKEFTEQLVSRIEHSCIENNDALIILSSRNVEKAFHYLDPPYPDSDQGHYKGYTFDDYEKLLKWCATECKGKFLLSSYNTEMLTGYQQIYGWHKKEITKWIGGKATLNSKLNRKDYVTEVLVSNYANTCNTLNLFE
jgi:DNA adenine methylase